MTQNLPIWSPAGPLVHIGSMQPAEKGMHRHEGHGLAVSECPEAWEQAAKLGDRLWWNLDRHLPQFLDFNKLDKAALMEIQAWGATEGLCDPCELYELTLSEPGEPGRATFVYDDRDKAERALADMLAIDNEDGTIAPALTALPGYRMTEAVGPLVGRTHMDVGETEKFITLLWVERMTELDGLYWADPNLLERNSAPFASILPVRLTNWTATPHPGHDHLVEPSEPPHRQERMRA